MKTKAFARQILSGEIANWYIIDIETTGLDKNSDHIIEVGILEIHNWQIRQHFHSLVFSDRELDIFISELTQISQQAINKAPKITNVFAKVIKFIAQNAYIVAHNFTFDKGFLAKTSLKVANYQWIDSIYLFKILFPELSNYKLTTITRQHSQASPLYGKAHNAMADITNLFYALKKGFSGLTLKIIDDFKFNAHNAVQKCTDVERTYKTNEQVIRQVFAHKKIAFTGSLMVSRPALIKKLNAIGASASSRLTSQTNMLIVGFKPGSKLARARKMGVTIILEPDLVKMLAKPN